MTHDIPKAEWKEFFNDLSKKRFEWRTKVEVISQEMGDQTMSDRLPLNGIAVGKKKGSDRIEISLGFDEDNHQTHTVVSPTAVRFKEEGENAGGVVEFEEANGTKTILYIVEPMPLNITVKAPDEIGRPA